jgi:hypothetical protein
LSTKDNQLDLFGPKPLPIEINGVRAVNSVDLYNLKIPFDSTPGKFFELKQVLKPGEFILHSSGAHHYFYSTGVTKERPNLLPKYFNEPIFPWIQSIHNKSGKIRVPGIPQSRQPYPGISIGIGSKKLQMHILIAAAFIPHPGDEKYCVVSHKNDMKWDYSIRNLFWNTHKGNSVGVKKERKLSPIEILINGGLNIKKGVQYDVDDWEVEEDQF